MNESDVNMKVKVEKVLEDTGNAENRPAKMDIDDLLK
jgi:18S rRNA (adenine1779-N6/adenine1780-N6)-dimethyltransferase